MRAELDMVGEPRSIVRDRPPRPSNGRVSAAIALVHAKDDFVMIHQAAFARGDTAFVDVTPEPFIVIDRAMNCFILPDLNGTKRLRNRARCAQTLSRDLDRAVAGTED